jgi:hypothetical protein
LNLLFDAILPGSVAAGSAALLSHRNLLLYPLHKLVYVALTGQCPAFSEPTQEVV